MLTSRIITALLSCFLSGCTLSATSLQEIERNPCVTPESFACLFRNFEFSFHEEVQSPETFLATRSGDCDDFSILASRVLRHHGYTPRLVTVRMPGIVHVVCYIEERNAYLDYNQRSSQPVVKCGRRISEIAQSVARSYSTTWVSASEFTSEGNVKRLVQTVQESSIRQLAAILR